MIGTGSIIDLSRFSHYNIPGRQSKVQMAYLNVLQFLSQCYLAHSRSVQEQYEILFMFFY